MMRGPISVRLKIPRITERHIQETCSSFLDLDGWRPLRTDPVSDRSRGKGFGELGMADHLYIRYPKPLARTIAQCLGNGQQAQAEVLWIEYKRERGTTSLNPKRALFTRAEKARIHQRAWIEGERAKGALVLLVGEDCPATIEGVQEWYAESGLMRRNLLSKRKETA